MVYFVPSLPMKSFHASNILANGRERACDCLPAHLYIHEAACCHSHSLLTSWLLVRTKNLILVLGWSIGGYLVKIGLLNTSEFLFEGQIFSEPLSIFYNKVNHKG